MFSASDQVLLRIQPLPLANMVHDLHLRGEMTRIAEFMTDAAAGIIAAAFILSQPRSVDGFLELLIHSDLNAGRRRI